ncbi:hypothetical protein VZ111_22460, partial [Enterobacter hormaechei]|nr:hypothetical protein [Enterobacter hormaechei]
SVEVIQYQDIAVDAASQTVLRNGARVPLTAREWAVLLQLLSHQGVLQSKLSLEESVYGWQRR